MGVLKILLCKCTNDIRSSACIGTFDYYLITPLYGT